MLTIHNLSYTHPDKKLLFSSVNLAINNNNKIALIGHNGAGKSTLLKIIAGILQPSAGAVKVAAPHYYVPQIFGQYNHLTIAEALGVDKKIKALHAILNGDTSPGNYDLLNDDWTIEERCKEALQLWHISDLNLLQKMENLSGGQKTKVFLAGIYTGEPQLILLDEPSNHLDILSRDILYNFIRNTRQALIVVSHDRKLLNLLDSMCELTQQGITLYGGNYDFYFEQKQIESHALSQDIHSKEKALKKAKDKERESIERQQKLDSRGKAKQEKSGVARIMMNTLRNKAENSTAKLKAIHTEKTGSIQQELQELRASLAETDQMKFEFDNSKLHKGKILFTATRINFYYGHQQYLWKDPLDLQVTSGERVIIKGSNGSGKTTLLKIILGTLTPQTGTVFVAEKKWVYIDQDYSLINNQLTIYEQAEYFNTAVLQEHEIKIRLNRFLFTKEDWNKPCGALSGGERMRLILCCLAISNQAPDIIVLDEPTNNLDIQNIEILTKVINDYQGTLLVISHDETFLSQIKTGSTIAL